MLSFKCRSRIEYSFKLKPCLNSSRRKVATFESIVRSQNYVYIHSVLSSNHAFQDFVSNLMKNQIIYFHEAIY